jgi:hypothetical protein
VISGLVVGAMLGAPAAPAEASATGTEAVGPSACIQHVGANESHVSAIREQFRTSFAAGAVTPPTTDVLPIICDQ